MVRALASASRLFGSDCRVVFCEAEPKKHCDWSCNRVFWFVASGICGGFLEKTGSADDCWPLRVHAQSALLWQFDFSGWGRLGDAFVDFCCDPRNLFCYRLLRCNAQRGRRTARPFWGRFRTVCEKCAVVFPPAGSCENGRGQRRSFFVCAV